MGRCPQSLVVGVFTALVVACSQATPAEVPAAPRAAASPSVAATGASDWSVLPVGELNQLVLGCVNGLQREGQRFVLRSTGDTFLSGSARIRPWIDTRGDFGMSATIGGDTETSADLTLVGVLPQGEYWQGTKRLDVGLRSGKLAILGFTGEKREPSIAQSFPTPGLSRPANVGVRKLGTELVFRVAGSEVGRITDPGLFPNGVVQFGVTVGPHTTMTISDLAVEAPPNGAASVAVVPGFLDAPASAISLRAAAAARSFHIGAFPDYIGTDPNVIGVLVDPTSRRTLAREYNQLTLGIFPVTLARSRDSLDFCEPDFLVAFGQAHQMEIRVQTLLYTVPPWLATRGLSPDQLLDWVHSYIATVVGRYRGKVSAWEVTNELFDFVPTDCTWNGRPGTSTLKESNTAFWVRSLGPGWLDQAFRWAHEADPQALLYYNENRAEGVGTKSDCVYAMVKGMKERGVPIDGVGMQSHFIIPEARQETWNQPPPMASVAANMRRYADLGLAVQVTEIDVKVGKGASAAELAAQARVYGDMLRTCLAAPKCTAFTSWGVSDRYSWIRGPLVNQPWEQPLPFDDAFQPKPGYGALLEALRR